MAEVKDYPAILRKIIENYAAIKPAFGDVESEVIIDESKGHYELIERGWSKENRVHGCLMHVDIRNGKFWIEHDGTEYGIANELVDAGVPKEHIVLAFHAPDLRQYTEFAAG
jgi:ketopantoate reductase